MLDSIISTSRALTKMSTASHKLGWSQMSSIDDSWAKGEDSRFRESGRDKLLDKAIIAKNDDPFVNFLGLLDLDLLHAIQFSLVGFMGGYVGARADWGENFLLGHGASFQVVRVPYDPSLHRVSAWRDPWEPEYSKFVVYKQPLLPENIAKEEDTIRLRAVLTELKVLFHEPLRKHPNIVKLLQIRWDTQDGPNLIAPTLVLEHAELGSLSAFQDPERIVLSSQTKTNICLDVANGLYFLHLCGIVHGDVKSEYAETFFKGI